MKTRPDNPSIVARPKTAPDPAALGENSPTRLAEWELEHVAAAGSKPGVAAGQGRCG